jgi:hypothetical protein
MKALIVTIVMVSMLVLATACAPESVDRLLGEAGGGGAQGDQSRQLLAEGKGPIEVTPNAPGGDVIASDDQAGGAISSSGEQAPGSAQGSQPGSLESSGPGGTSGEAVSKPVNWLIYTDENFKFSISYPDIYVILSEVELLRDIDPDLAHRVRFQDADLAKGDTADLEPPQFSIEIFKNTTSSLESFLDTKLPGARREPYKIGDLQGYRVSTNLLMAPNEFYFFPGNGYVYKLTPMGAYSQEMLESFKLLR